MSRGGLLSSQLRRLRHDVMGDRRCVCACASCAAGGAMDRCDVTIWYRVWHPMRSWLSLRNVGLPRWQRDVRAAANARGARRDRERGLRYAAAPWVVTTTEPHPYQGFLDLVKKYPSHRCSVAYWRDLVAQRNRRFLRLRRRR